MVQILTPFLSIWLASAAIAQVSEADTRLADALSRAVGNPKGQNGIAVFDVATGRLIFESEAQQPLKPASVLKLFTTAAALDRFGPDFRFATDFFLRDGELIIRGAGDPGLGDERLAQRVGKSLHYEFDELADALRTRGVTHLRTVAVDDFIFDQEWRHPDWDADQQQAWYQAPVGGLNFNDNCLDSAVTLRGGAAQLTLHPPLPPDFIDNHLTPGRKHAPLVTRPRGDGVFRFSGTVARSGDFEPVAANEPTIFAAHAIAQALRERGITVDERIVRRDTRAQQFTPAERVYSHVTPLTDVIWRANTVSQNLFAECLVKSLAAYGPDGRPTGTPGSWESGTRVVRDTLDRLGLDLRGAQLRDGSGLSHDNRVTAAQIARLLVALHRHRFAERFAESLAQPGQEGTLKNRLNDAALKGRLRGKTGTIQGVHCLAGYATRPDGRVLAFALMMNGAPSRELELRLCRALVAR